MLKKIYQELLLIRKELQAIRSSMESSGGTQISNGVYDAVAEINKETKKNGKSPLII